MMRSLSTLAAALALAVPFAPAAASGVEAAGVVAQGQRDAITALETGLADLVASGQFPNAHAVIVVNGEERVNLRFGMADIASRRPLPDDAIFRLYSMTKPVTTVAAMMLVEQGVIALDAPISRYLPEFADMRVWQAGEGDAMVTVPALRQITVADLLTHSSGLTYSFMGDTPVHRYYNAHGVMRGGQVGIAPGSAPPAATMGELIARLGAAPLLFQPGERWHYSNATGVLGVLVERASGMKLEDFFATRIFAPLGMSDTTFLLSDDQAARLVTNYASTADGMIAIETAELSEYRDPSRLFDGGGALAGTMRDYLRFAQMLANRGELDGHRLLSESSVDAMFTPRFPTGGRAHEDVLFGLGLGIGDAASEAIGSMPAGAGGWSGSANSYFFVDPRVKLVAVVMTNELVGPDQIGRTEVLRTLLNRAGAQLRDEVRATN